MPKIIQFDPESRKDEVTQLWWKCFNPNQTVEEVAKWAHRDLDEMEVLWGAEEAGKLVAVLAATKDCENSFRGAKLKFSGIGGVATLPEYRRDRLVRKMFKPFFHYANKQDIVISALEPFDFPFYEKFGYAMSGQNSRYEFPSTELKPIQGPAGITCKPYDPENDADDVMAVQRSMARFGSRLFIPLHRLKSKSIPHGYVFERDGEIVGCILVRFKEAENTWKLRMNINYTWFKSDDVLPAIVDFVYRYGSQTKEISWTMEPEIPLEYFLKNPGHQTRKREGHMMFRVLKFKEFCQQITAPMAATESVVVKLTDEHCPWNDGVWKLTPSGGRLEIQPTKQEPEISFTALQLSHALGGLMTASLLQRIAGLDCSLDAAERFTKIFPAISQFFYAHF